MSAVYENRRRAFMAGCETCRPSPQNVAQAHLADPVDRRLAKMIGRSMQIPGRHGFEVLFREFMQRGYEAQRKLPKGGR